MKISIITPHYNDFKGVKRTHTCLISQDSDQWEWIIVDDFSDKTVTKELQDYFDENERENVKIVFNNTKTNGSVCRNIGIDRASYEHLVFLDSDDVISENFVSNRLIEVEDFVVFKNSGVLDEKGNSKLVSPVTDRFLDCFLQAKFIWPITAILWNKYFLIKIGEFNPDLKRLQDIELSIRALFLGINYKVIDNKVDFFYCVAPINSRKRPVKLICDSVDYLITNIHANYELDTHQKSLLKGYYFLCTRYFFKSNSRKDTPYLRSSLALFKTKGYVSKINYIWGEVFIYLYEYHVISIELFLKLNRYFFK